MQVTGRSYLERRSFRCWECDHPVTMTFFVSACIYEECRVLMCEKCRELHISLHELAGDRLKGGRIDGEI